MCLSNPYLQKSLKKLGYYSVLGLMGFFVVLLGSIPLRLTIAIHQAPQPQAIFVLGGTSGREAAAAQVAKHYPNLEVWLSSGELPNEAYAIFQAAGVSPDRLHLDYRATDTVTNFTTLVGEFKQHKIQHLYLITSDFHMPRAKVIATLVLGSRGIACTPIAVPSNRPQESTYRIARDAVRSLLWIVTGRTGGRVGLMLQEKLLQLIGSQQ